FIDQNIERIGRASGREDLLALRQQLEQAAAARARSALQVERLEASIDAGNWAAVASTLQSEPLAELQRQRQAVAESRADAAAGPQQRVGRRAELARIEAGLAESAEAAPGALRQQVAANEARAGELRDELRSTILSSNRPADVLTRIYELQQNAEIARN